MPASEPAEPAADSDEPALLPLPPETLRLVVERTTKARGLEEARRVRIEQLSEEAFRQRIREQLASSDVEGEDKGDAKPTTDATPAVLLGLNLVPPPEERKNIASGDAVLQEQIAAYYDSDNDVVVLPVQAARDEDEQLQRRAVLAHEIQHALQKRHFDLQPLPTNATLDERIARLALVEGDAMATMGAYLGAELDRPVQRTLMAITDMVSKVDRERIHRQRSRQLDNALPIMRDTLLFPYREGMMFVTDLYRAGGFDLVNQSYIRPPTSTMQVLHPQKYIDGVEPARYPALPALAGVTLKHQLSLGELVSRVVIERCGGAEVARAVTDGWAGDQMAFGVLPNGAAVTMWLSYWANDDNAAEIVQVLDRPGCWLSNASDDTSISDNYAVRRQRNRVVLIRGAEPAAMARWMNPLLRVVPREVPPKPRSNVRIPKRVKPVPLPPGFVQGDQYLSESLGIEATIPRKAMVKLNSGGLALRLSWPDSGMAGLVAVSERLVSPEANSRAFDEIGEALSAGEGGHQAKQVVGYPWASPLGPSEVRLWKVAGVRVRAVLIPICANNGSILILQASKGPAEQQILDDWVKSFRWIGDTLPICGRLDPQ